MSTRDYAIIELDRPRKPGVAVLKQLANDVEEKGPRLTVANLSQKDLQGVMASDRYVGHAPAMPLRLIKGSPDATAHFTTSGLPWGIEAVGAHSSQLHGERLQGRGVKVAILDTGIDLEHDAFSAIKARIEVKDFTNSGPGDPIGHGTHCAGTIFGQDVDGVRIGVAPGIERALVGRVFNADGKGNSLDLFRAMQWAIMAPVGVLSMSLGFDFPRVIEELYGDGVPLQLAAAQALNDFLVNVRVFDTLVKLAREMGPVTGGTVVVAAAGNESKPAYRVPLSQPANADGVISVGAAESSPKGWRIASFSNTGPSVSAPGVNVLSAVPVGKPGDPKLTSMSGTSMAAPHVAGIAALWFEALREQGELAIATRVADRVTSRTAQKFAPDTAPNDRGNGLAHAP